MDPDSQPSDLGRLAAASFCPSLLGNGNHQPNRSLCQSRPELRCSPLTRLGRYVRSRTGCFEIRTL
jgi:hypothetical protein